VDIEDFFAADHIRIGHHDLTVEAARTQQRRIEHVGTVGRRDQDDAFVGFKPVHFNEELVQRLLAFVIAAAKTGAAMTADRVNLVDEDNAGRVLFRLFEHVADARCADADKHLDEIGTGDREERHIGFAGDGARQKRFTGARRTDQQRAFRDLAAKALELHRVFQILDDFL